MLRFFIPLIYELGKHILLFYDSRSVIFPLPSYFFEIRIIFFIIVEIFS